MKSVLITGCSEGGIGAALALAFETTGRYHVFATARNTSKIPATLHSSKNTTILTLDVTQPDSIGAAVRDVAAQVGGKLDVLINNSGAGMVGTPILDCDVDATKAVFDVNFFGLLAMSQAFAPLLAKAKGTIANVSSVAGERWFMYTGPYAASKAAATSLSECLRLEVSALGINVITLVTGVVKSKIVQNQGEVKLPATSLYACVEQDLKDGAQRDFEEMQGIDGQVYAKGVIKAIESRATGKVWLGQNAGLLRGIAWWMPQWMWDKINYSRHKEQGKLKQATDQWRSS